MNGYGTNTTSPKLNLVGVTIGSACSETVVSRVLVVVPDLREAGFAGLGCGLREAALILASAQEIDEVLDLDRKSVV